MTPNERAARVSRTYVAMSALDWFADMLITVTSVLLFRERGLGATAIFGMIAAVWLIEALFEIPTGIAADVFGRRRAILASLALRAIGYSALFFSGRIEIVIAGTLVAAIGSTFLSGALEAWAVDELTALGHTEMDRLFTRSRIFENVGLVLGTLTGAVLGMKSLALPQLAAGVSSCAGFIVVTLFVKETTRSTANDFTRRVLGASRDIMRATARLVRTDRVLVGLVVVSALLWTLRGVPGVQWSAHFERIATNNLLVLGVMRCSSALAEIPLLFVLARVQERYKTLRKNIIVLATAIGGSLLFLSSRAESPLVSILAYVGFTVTTGLCMPGIRAAINERIDAAHRATALSCVAFFGNAATGLGLLFVGAHVAKLEDVHVTWPIVGTGFALVGLVAASLAGRRREATPRVAPFDQAAAAE